MKKILLVLSLIFSLASFQVVLAAGPLDKATGNLTAAVGGTGLSSDFATSVGTVIKGVLSLVGTIFLVLTVYAGILWMTAQGSEEKVNKAKNIIQAAVIGLFIVMAAYAITAFVTSKVGGAGVSSDTCSSATGGGCQNPINCTNHASQDYECVNSSEWCCLP